MDSSDYFAKIFYHFYNRYYNLMLSSCKESMAKFPTNVAFKLYHSLALMLTNRLEEGVHDLEGLAQEIDIKLASTIALMYGHKLLGVANRDLFVKLDLQMKEYRKQAEPQDFYNSAFALVVLNKPEKALDYVEKAISLKTEGQFSTFKGWIMLLLKTLGKHNFANIKTTFRSALQSNPKDLLAILGYTECCLHLNETGEALNVINQALVKFTLTNLPLLEKIKVHFASQDWDQTSETIGRFSITESDILYGLKYEILIGLLSSQDYKTVCKSIRKFSELIKKFENNNVKAILESSKLFSRLCHKNESIVNETIDMLNGVIPNNADNAQLVVELGNQHCLLGKTREAARFYKSATKIDEGCFEAFLGLSTCEFLDNGKTPQLEKQIQYLVELKDAGSSLGLHLLQAKVSGTPQEALGHLNMIFDVKIHSLKASYYSDEYLLSLDIELTLDVIKEYLRHAGGNKAILENALELARALTKACPNLAEALYLLAKLQHLKGDNISATATLESMTNNLSSEASLLMAQIQVNNGQFERAFQSLEACISSDFKIRENPSYHFIMALVDKHSRNYGDAIKALTAALTLSNVDAVSSIDRASIYVELIDTLNIVGQTDEALKVLEEATQDLRGTAEESRILLLSADNLLARKNVQGAIDLLKKIEKRENCHREARMKMADVFLKYRRDKNAFLQIFQEFAAEDPTAESYISLGDAYMKILEPDRALENYEKALKASPNDLFLTAKMGKALLRCHYFGRAVDYYKRAVKETNDPDLKLQLAELYLNLHEYEKGELLLLNEIEEDGNPDDVNHFVYRAKLYHLLANIQEKSGNFTYAVKSLKDCMDCQLRVRKRITVEENGSTDEIDKHLSSLSLKLGEMAITMKNKEQAINYYKEGLSVSPNNVQILVALAKLYMQMNYLELCQQTCGTILRIDQENEAASVMMADIAFRKVDFDMALFHFTQLVSKQPTNWDALTRLIEISRRLGQIQECEQYLNIAEEQCVNPLKEPGFLYCKAYYQWHSGNLNSALKNFNQARQDSEYGTNALCNMIEICLNPDGETLAEQFMDSDDIEYRDSRSLALKTAERLLRELKQRLESNGEDLLKHRLLVNFRLLATKEKYNIERALDDFVAVASQNATKEHLGAILGISSAYTLLKQQQRAKNQLKRVVKNPWNFDDAEYLEKCWLLLADQYIQSNKLESANELISKVIQHNKACIKALEYSGYICEKDHRFKEAANNYQQAWKVGLKSNANVGFKLAYCLMKCKKYPDAIDVANEVLKLNPDFSNVKKDILNKCMNNLRI